MWILQTILFCLTFVNGHSTDLKALQDNPILFNFTDIGSACHHQFSFKMKREGIFTSPSFPDKYPNEKECVYFFQAPPGGRIKISFDYFDLEAPSDKGCQFDYIEINSVNDGGFKHMVEKLCGSEIPSEFISQQPKMEIVFRSDSTQNLNGFLAHYEFLGENWHPFGPSTIGCGPGYLQGTSGLITSPHYPDLFPAESQCSWVIKVKDTEKILLQILDLNIARSRMCTETFLMFFNGFAIQGMLSSESYCDSLVNIPMAKREFLSTASRVVIRFESGTSESSRRSGFQLVWTAVTLSKPGDCKGFTCKGTEDCANSRTACSKSPVKYCIEPALRCNRVRNCGQMDDSDEDNCLSSTVQLVIFITVPIIIVLMTIFILVLCYRRHKNRRRLFVKNREAHRHEQTHWVSPHIRGIEQSPNHLPRPQIVTSSFIDSKQEDEQEFEEDTVLQNKCNNQKIDSCDMDTNDIQTKEPDLPAVSDTCTESEALQDPDSSLGVKRKKDDNTLHVKFDLNVIPNYKTHQKRSSYQLMQELNMGESEVMIAKV